MSGTEPGLLLLISAPSGAGKTTVCQNLLAADSNLVRAVTCTTRAAREGEQNGRDYYFLSEEEFHARLERGEFLESALVYGNRYGTLKSEIERLLVKGQNVLLNIDVQGVANLRDCAAREPLLARSLVTVFLTPSSWTELERRLRIRGSDSDRVIEARLRSAADELAASFRFDYLVLSESMDEDRRRIECILTAEMLRRHRVKLPAALEREAKEKERCG